MANLTIEQLNDSEHLYYVTCDLIKELKFKTNFKELCEKLEAKGIEIKETSAIYLAMDWAHQWTSKSLY